MNFQEYNKLLESIWNDFDKLDSTKTEREIDGIIEQLKTTGDAAMSETDFSLLKAKSYLLKGKILGIRKEYSAAVKIVEQALQLVENINSANGIATCLGELGNISYDTADYSSSVNYLKRGIVLAEEHGLTSVVERLSGNLGATYLSISDHANALKYLHQALGAAEQLNLETKKARHFGNIGSVYWAMHDYAKALEYSLRALDIAKNTDNTPGEGKWKGNIGILYTELKEYGAAMEYLNNALAISEQSNDLPNTALWHGNIGNVHRATTEYSRALESYNKALDISIKLGDKRQKVIWLGNLGTLFAIEDWDSRNVALAEQYLLQAISLSEEIGEKFYRMHFLKDLSKLCKEQRRWEALDYLEKAYDLEREVENEQTWNQSALLEQQRIAAEYEKEIEIAKAAATAELNATNTLLRKVLPAPIAARLLKGETVADYFPNVSILFTDIVGFTPIASRMPAKAVLAFLNHLFAQFDAIMDRHGCQKIKTIGDGYMAVAGAPVACDDHAERIAGAALELTSDIVISDDILARLPGNSNIRLRVGLHMGAAFAGVIGEHGFVYDIYSDAVNIASRMESHGEAGRIHVSDVFAMHLMNRDDSFCLAERGEIEIKGKGLMRTYFLENRSKT